MKVSFYIWAAFENRPPYKWYFMSVSYPYTAQRSDAIADAHLELKKTCIETFDLSAIEYDIIG